jgi:hypothetical protein
VPRSVWLAGLALLAAAIVGILANDYGQSTDDEADARYGAEALRAYVGSPEFLNDAGDRRYYGPAYWMFSAAVVEALDSTGVDAASVDVRHGLNALLFLVAVGSVYALARMTGVDPPAALLAAALFGLQPLLFGHAFINQKDIPFMALFALSVAVGLATVRRVRQSLPPGPAPRQPDRTARIAWGASGRRPIWWMLSLILGLILLVGLIIDLLGRGWLYSRMIELLELAYLHTGPAWARPLFAGGSGGDAAIPFSVYALKAELLYGWTSVLGALAVAAATVAWSAVHLPGVRARINRRSLAMLGWFALAGATLGLCVSIRVAGALAGALVISAALFRPSRRMTGGLVVYWFSAATIGYLTWPYLWLSPVPYLLKAIQLTLRFPMHLVLYDGGYLSSTQLPASYLPKLVSAQLTESALLLIAVGIVLAVVHLVRRRPFSETVLILLIWFFLPAAYVVSRQPSIYNNFRQLLFILPPAFVLAGLAVEWIFRRVRSPIARIGLAGLILLPGILGIVRLHPYEYVYYNSTVGGVRGAAGRFELDYWCTSYREAMEQVNREAPANARIAVGPPVSAARTFARADLHVDDPYAFDEPLLTLVCDARRGSSGIDLSRPVAYRVMVDVVDLAKVLRNDTDAKGGSSP